MDAAVRLRKWAASPRFIGAARVLLAVAVVASLVGALWPDPSSDRVFKSDKVLHMVAFATLAVLAAFSFPRTKIIKLVIWLSIFGALIELLQGLPIIGRDADAMDWLADTAAVVVVLSIFHLARGFLTRAR
jgi:VanZ family protein